MKFKKKIAVLLAAGIILSGTAGYSVSVPVSAIDCTEEMFKMLAMINQARSEAGASSLTATATMTRAATARIQEVTENFSNLRPNGSQGYTIMDDFDIDYTIGGENDAFGYSTAEKMMDAFLNSEKHKEKIIDSRWNYVGVSVTEYNGKVYWVQLFADEVGADTLPISQPTVTSPELGDVNGDGLINAQDAALILTDSARIGSGYSGVLYGEQQQRADLDGDSKRTASDAAMILKYSAYLGTNGKQSLKEFFGLS